MEYEVEINNNLKGNLYIFSLNAHMENPQSFNSLDYFRKC